MRVTYRLDGKFARFEAVVGLDPAVGRKGRARLALIVDGKRHPLADGKELTADDAPLVVRQDVHGARMLSLVVDNGSFGDVQTRVNWGGPPDQEYAVSVRGGCTTLWRHVSNVPE